MSRNSTSKALILPAGIQVLPDTLEGYRGRSRGSHGGYRMPEEVRYASGKFVTAWYCHFYKTEREHYHTSHEELEECGKLYP